MFSDICNVSVCLHLLKALWGGHTAALQSLIGHRPLMCEEEHAIDDRRLLAAIIMKYLFREGKVLCYDSCPWGYSGKINTENMKICLKMHARAEVMINRASKAGDFPLSRRNILFFAQHKAESPSQKWWF